MGNVYAEITLKNALDAGNARQGLIKEEQVRNFVVTVMVDTYYVELVLRKLLNKA